MHAKTAANRPGTALPFVGRGRETARLKQLHAQRKHVLILGPAGVGKSALVGHLCEQLPLLLCPRSEHLGGICESLEAELGLAATDWKLAQRKQRVRQALAEARQTVIFDGVGWTTPKLSSFLEGVMAHVPVWLCARSDHSWDIGHFWTLLVRFARVELHPFHLAETQALVEATAQRGMIPRDARRIVAWLHRRSGGSPQILGELFAELATGHYDLSSPFALRRLELDRRIHQAFPA